MFERYIEKARRVVFFARYEASQFGSPFIETEHLLLGILRDDKELIRHVLLKVDLETARQNVVSRIKPGKYTSTSIDLPLSEQAKRALMYAAEEADRLNHRHIGTAHLLLGLVRDKEFASAEFLSRLGATLESLRKKVEALGDPPREVRLRIGEDLRRSIRDYVAGHRHPPSTPSTVEIHSVKRDLDQIHAAWTRCSEASWRWEQKHWKPRDVVMKKGEKTLSFDLSLAKKSPDEFLLVRGGWKKDYCSVCRWELFKSKDVNHGVGFTNGRDWLCTECYQRFIAGNFFASPYSDIT